MTILGSGTGNAVLNTTSSTSRASSRSSSSSTVTSCIDGDEFPRAVAKAAVAQICDFIGFQSIQRSALDAFADITLRFLCDVGKAAHFYANMAGRTQSNALDVILALEDLGLGAVEIHRPLSSSGALKEVMRFVEYGEEMPFAKPLPHFPVSKKRTPIPSFIQLGETPPHPHIPPWLPAFPDVHTYKFTPVWNERKTDPTMDKLEQAKQRRKAERSLVSLHLRLSSHGAFESSSRGFGQSPSSRFLTASGPPLGEQDVAGAKRDGDTIQLKGKGRQSTTAVQNPFLASPLPADAKEVTDLGSASGEGQGLITNQRVEGQMALPSVLEAFTPALEAVRNGIEGPLETSMDSKGLAFPDARSRSPVLLKFDFGRKASHKAMTANLSLGAPNGPFTGKDKKRLRVQTKEDEKDEKKRRAEQILKQAMEGTEEIAQ